MAGRAGQALWALCVVLIGLAAIAPPGRAQGTPDCGALAGPTGQRYVLFLAGYLSSSLTGLQPGVLDPTNHGVRDVFAPMRAAIEGALAPAPRMVYFSYGVARRWSLGESPESAWLGDTFFAENEPRYWSQDTSDFPVQAHAEALGWITRELLRCDPAATLDVVGFSLGGVVALRWVATEEDGPESPLGALRRVVLVDSPVGGVNPAILASALGAAPPPVVVAAGSGLVIGDLLPGSEVIRSLPAALDRVDVASVENSRDYLVNGHPLPGGPIGASEGWLARGAAVSFLSPARYPDAYYADMGDAGPAVGSLWDYLLLTHGVVLLDPGAHQRVVELLRSDGSLWQSRR